MKRIIGIIGCMVILMAICSLSQAAEYWVLLGQRTIADRSNHDIVYVTAANGMFRAIKITVARRSVEFKDVKVSFADGTSQDIKIRRILRPKEGSGTIDLAGNKRVINRIEFWYDAKSLLGRRAVIRIFGLKVGDGR